MRTVADRISSSVTLWLDRSVALLGLPESVAALCEFLDHLAVEGGDIVGPAARDKTVIYYHLSVNPLRPGVLEVGLYGRIGCHSAALYDACINQSPRAVANGRYWLARLEERFDELHRLAVHTKLVGIHHPTGQEERVVFVCSRFAQGHVNRELVAPLRMLPALHL